MDANTATSILSVDGSAVRNAALVGCGRVPMELHRHFAQYIYQLPSYKTALPVCNNIPSALSCNHTAKRTVVNYCKETTLFLSLSKTVSNYIHKDSSNNNRDDFLLIYLFSPIYLSTRIHEIQCNK